MAALDIGSNSVRLLLCTGLGPDGPDGERFTTITQLRRGAAPDGSVTEEALGRLDACLADYGERLAPFGAERVLVIATSATRDAPNRDRIEEVVRRRVGAGLTVVSGDEEAELAFSGARLAATGDGPTLILDIGGGSTELVHGDAAGVHDSVSMQMGAVRFTERHLHSDPPTADEMAALRADARAELDAVAARFPGHASLIGVAGTITTIAAIELGDYDPETVHGHRLDIARVDAVTERLAGMTVEERRRTVGGLHPDRAGVIVAGCAIAGEALRALGVEEMVVSERDLLDGAALRALAELDSGG